ncbi:hypothetical protein GH714_018615 [Hevea brasiliensis]|uniref:SANT domain-containing protein n=1 Tax=Hevea brasiliensis TaxID=3981 RepID=A0A6A6MNH3_HEVBR|nr:hypothetical protein GH714_018615 [Hevea brasiliensis]
MDVVQVNQNWNCIDESAEHSLHPEALGISDAFRDPELLPRIGDQYQVEIPPLMTKSAYFLLTEMANDPVIMPGSSHDFLVGLPISLMWIKEEVKNIKHEHREFLGDLNGSSNRNKSLKYESNAEIQIFPGSDLQVKSEPMDVLLNSAVEDIEPAKLDLQEEKKNHQQLGGKSYLMVPGSLGVTWNDFEEASFLLGLYIFGKNLVQVKKFVESKQMGDILSFYYGKFYRSERYYRWSECQKIRSRRCIYGQRIFTGSTQQELLSRLFLHLSEECKNTLMEVSKTFGEGKMLLEEYVLTLKAVVGMNNLVEAVGIGKGKQDLTGIAMEPLKSNQVATGRPEIPVGKACSTLSPLEIVNFLTGGYRLSKARSNDLFWEAVWPRLLARGWHSEQPNDYGFAAASRHSLVFLVPGIKKFSRRKLVRGEHYFDSVSDVLNKVASDPALLELDVGADKILDQRDFPNQQRHCYLKPRTPSHRAEVMKFTVVDTSLANGETSTVNVDVGDSSGRENFENIALRQCSPVIGSGFTQVPVKIPKDQNASKYDDMHPSKHIKGQAIKRTKPANRNLLGPVAKRRRRLTVCDHAVTSCCTVNVSVDPRLEQDEVGFTSGNHDLQENTLSYLDSHQAKLSSTSSSSRGSPNITDECNLSSNLSVAEHPNEKSQSRTLIDLNTHPEDAETEALMMEMIERQHDKETGQTQDFGMLKTSASVCGSTSEQPPGFNSRRQSTRNRPLTTKALEALACGFLSKSRIGGVGMIFHWTTQCRGLHDVLAVR